MGLFPVTELQGELFLFHRPDGDEEKLMKIYDTLNARLGAGTLFYAVQGVDRSWKNRREFVSPGYTARWEELLEI